MDRHERLRRRKWGRDPPSIGYILNFISLVWSMKDSLLCALNLSTISDGSGFIA